MKNDDDKSILVSVLAGIGLGALIGAAAGLLFAPKAGTETREDIMKAAEGLKSKAEDVIGEIGTQVDDLVHKGKDLVESTKVKVQNAVETGKAAVAQKKEELQSKAETEV